MPTVPNAVRLIVCVLVGYGIGRWSALDDFDATTAYSLFTGCLLAVGLYASTYAIALDEARRHWRLIVAAVTVGVAVKAVLIGGVLVLVLDDPRFWVLGIVVAQVDPLSVAAVMRDAAVSARAKAILAAWSSFDDPMTVLLALYVPALVVAPASGAAAPSGGIGGYLTSLALNLALAAVAYGAWRLGRRRWRSRPRVIGLAVLSAMLVVAVGWWLMVAVALAGLLVRPPGLGRHLDRAVGVALLAAAALVGIALTDGVDVAGGALLGAAAFLSHAVVATVLTRGLPARDRVFLALAQQNGITAIILALMLEPAYPGTVAVVMPAILTVALLHAVAGRVVTRRQPALPPTSATHG